MGLPRLRLEFLVAGILLLSVLAAVILLITRSPPPPTEPGSNGYYDFVQAGALATDKVADFRDLTQPPAGTRCIKHGEGLLCLARLDCGTPALRRFADLHFAFSEFSPS